MDTVDARRQDLRLRPFLAAVRDKILAGLEGVVPGHHVGKDAPGRNSRTIGGLDQADLPFADLGGRALGNLEQIGIDAIVAGRDDFDLRPLLAAVLDKGFAVLKGGVPFHCLGEYLAFRDGDTVNRLHDADFKILDLGDVALGQFEQVGVDPVFAGREHLDLRSLLAAVLDKRLAILKGIMAGHDRGKDAPGRDGRSVHRLDQADLVFQYLGENAFGCLVDKRDQEMQAGTECPGLDTDFIAKGHNPPLGHLAAEPPALDQGDLIAAHDDHGLVHQDSRGNQQGQIPPIFHYKIENSMRPPFVLLRMLEW